MIKRWTSIRIIPEAWNLKGLSFYKMKNYDRAVQFSVKAIDADPNDGMSWYNRACYLTLLVVELMRAWRLSRKSYRN